ncbi:MAG: hypothetical protein AMJ54_00495 [Deltaproteobacteria bacterium SG8_13]|nr:MAG: hypothetical protein AMJ54_00495 [Deltaproteobacteria bacterium SG8_13]
MVNKETLYPVLLAVPESARRLPPPERVKYLSRYARTALTASARKSRITLGDLEKDAEGRPLPSNGIHWSLTHKIEYVGAVVSRAEIGIDLEKVKPRNTQALFGKTAADEEWEIAGGKSWDNFHRVWTSKEAVLKAIGIGLKDLSACRVVAVIDSHHLVVAYHDRLWPVQHYFFDGHIASIVKGDRIVEWTLMVQPP